MISRRSVAHFQITMYELCRITGQKDGVVGYMLIEAMGMISYLLGQTDNAWFFNGKDSLTLFFYTFHSYAQFSQVYVLDIKIFETRKG